MINPTDPKYVASAPCYWEIVDDGAPFRCSDCMQRDSAVKMIGVLTPNGIFRVMHRDCVEPHWLANAKKMEGRL